MRSRPDGSSKSVLRQRGISHAEFARRCGRSPKADQRDHLGQSVARAGNRTAIRESSWHRCQRLARGLSPHIDFTALERPRPVNAAAFRRMGHGLPRQGLGGARLFPALRVSEADTVSKLLAFFRRWISRCLDLLSTDCANVAYRHSPTFKSNVACTGYLDSTRCDRRPKIQECCGLQREPIQARGSD